MNCIDTDERELFRRRLVNDVIGDGGTCLTPLLPAYGQELLEAVARIYEESGKKDRYEIELTLTRLADHKDQQHRNWLLCLLADRLDVSSMNKTTITRLGNRLEGALNTISSSDTAGSDNRDEGDKPKPQGTLSICPDKARDLARALGIVLECEKTPSRDDEDTEQVQA